jgi:hypothetical protein
MLGKRGAADTLMLCRVVAGRLVPVAVIPMSAIMMRRMADRVRCLRKRHCHRRHSEAQREQNREQAAEHGAYIGARWAMRQRWLRCSASTCTASVLELISLDLARLIATIVVWGIAKGDVR